MQDTVDTQSGEPAGQCPVTPSALPYLRLSAFICVPFSGWRHTARHCAAVAAEARRLAARFGGDPEAAETAGWLHDVSAVVPDTQRLAAAREFGLEVLPAEEIFPMLLHQKLSALIARELFGVTDESVLSAIGSHTTLRAGATALDKVLFVADKVAWDQPGEAPFHPALRAALEVSLDAAARAYLDYIWERRHALRVVHPWAKAAYGELAGVAEEAWDR